MWNVGLRGLAVLFAMAALTFPGFGLIDLLTTWDPDWPVVLEAGWGLLFTVLVGTAFVAIAVFPRRSAPAVVQLLVVSGALGVSAAISREAPALALAAVLTAQTLLFLAIRDREALRPRPLIVWWPLALVASLGVVPWSIYAWRMYEANRMGLRDDITIGVDHYAVQGATAIGIAALAFLAAIWPRGRRFIGVCVGLVAGYLGVVSYAWPGTPAAYHRVWSLLSVAWGVVIAMLALVAPCNRRQPGS